MTKRKLQGKVAVVTGATSGIGEAIADCFARQGAKVVLSGRREYNGQKNARKIIDAGGEALFVKMDVTQVEQVKEMVRAAMETYGRIDILVNNAGIRVNKHFEQSTKEDWERLMATDGLGYCLTLWEILPIMIRQGSGCVINMSSKFAVRPSEHNPFYCFVKAALLVEYGKPLEIHEVPIPQIEPRAILVKVEMAGICGTDIHQHHDTLTIKSPLPNIQGHETIGRIVALGQGRTMDVAEAPLKIGDRIMWAHTDCGECYFCEVARTQVHCSRRKGYGFDSPVALRGGFAEYEYITPLTKVVKVPDALCEEEAVGVGCAFRSVVAGYERLGGVKLQESVVVQGSGPIGLYSTVMAREGGAGKIIEMAPGIITGKGLTVIGSISAAIQHFYKALQFIKNKQNKYPFADIVSKKYQLEQINEAFDNMAAGQDIKPVIDNRNR